MPLEELPYKDGDWLICLLQVVGNLLYYRYMNPAIVAPDGFDIVDVSAEQQLTSDQRRNLGNIAKVLQYAAANKKVKNPFNVWHVIIVVTQFEEENAALSAINPYIEEAFKKFRWVSTASSLNSQ